MLEDVCPVVRSRAWVVLAMLAEHPAPVVSHVRTGVLDDGQCGAQHDRDVNAARNFLAPGIAQPVIESAAVEAKACEAVVDEARAEVGSDLPAEGIFAV